jgi:hypothetical protein
MKISEKQVLSLIRYIDMVQPMIHGEAVVDLRNKMWKLLEEITLQQSDELREVE